LPDIISALLRLLLLLLRAISIISQVFLFHNVNNYLGEKKVRLRNLFSAQRNTNRHREEIKMKNSKAHKESEGIRPTTTVLEIGDGARAEEDS
jgi:hypothetical protein